MAGGGLTEPAQRSYYGAGVGACVLACCFPMKRLGEKPTEIRRRGALSLETVLDVLLGFSLTVIAPAVGFAEPRAAEAHAPPALFEATSQHSFGNVEYWKTVFDDPERDQWQKPDRVVSALGLEPGMRVADLGAGTGYFSSYLSRAVGEEGSVLAVETEPKLVEYLRQRAEKEGTSNLVPVLASFDNPRVPRSSVDVVLMVNTFHHIDSRLDYLEGLKRVLRASGKIAIVDWYKHTLPLGPPPEHKIEKAQVIEEMKEAGYGLAGEQEFLPYQYYLIFVNVRE